MKLEIEKKYKTRNGMTVEIVDELVDDTIVCRDVVTDYTYDYKQNGLCHCGQARCDYDIVSEVVETKDDWVDIVRPRPKQTKQNTFTISVDLPQGTQSINLERTVEIEGVPYLANIKLERM